MARSLLLLLAALAITNGDQAQREAIEGELDSNIHNLKFMLNMVSVAAQNQLYGAQQVELERSSSHEQSECVREVTRKAMETGVTGMVEPLSSLLAQLEQTRQVVINQPTEQDLTKAAEWLKQLDYAAYKKTILPKLKVELSTWVPAQQMRMEECLKV